jgi:hypothetical protein
MPRYLNTRGNTTLAIGICGRCSIKMPLADLLPDPNYPGLLVCEKDRDQYDPYRLPARQPDNILLPFLRPDVPLATNPAGVITQNSEQFLITEDSDDYLIFFEDDEF